MQKVFLQKPIVTSKQEYTNLISNLKRAKNNAKKFEAAFYQVFDKFKNEIELKMGPNGLIPGQVLFEAKNISMSFLILSSSM